MPLPEANPQPDANPIVMWELTRACRLGCAHCAVGAQQRRSPLELSTYEGYKTIDQIASLRPAELNITGGDLLERADIYQLIDYARRRGIAPTVTLTVTPALTGSVIGKLRHNGAARVAIAVDSAMPERHDAARGLSGQFASTLLALRWARTANIPIEVNTLLSRGNVKDLQTLAELLADIGAVRWNIYLFVPTANTKRTDALNANEVEAAFETIYELAQRTPFEIRTFEGPQYRRFVVQKTAKELLESVEPAFDNAGRAQRQEVIFISHTGEVTASPFLPLAAGNVRYQPLGLIYRTNDLFVALRDTKNLKGKCGRCEFKPICNGSRARAFALTGDLFAPDPLCAYQPGTFSNATPALNYSA
jgi:radical SAM protein with 4Fe4S-binding SPASM domain